MARRKNAWPYLLKSGADLALVQEATEPPKELASQVKVSSVPWQTEGAGVHRPWRSAVVGLSGQIEIGWFDSKPIGQALKGELAVSRIGTLEAAKISQPGIDPFIVVSLYSIWESPVANSESSWIYADGSAHRLVSDLSAFVGRQTGHRIIAAGDLNILKGYGENGSPYWARRYATLFSRMEAIGIPFVGPRAPLGHQVTPWPSELPKDSLNVPTFHSSHQTPASATRQLDFVFASRSLGANLQVEALNAVEQWGPSDHCQIQIRI